MPKTTSSEFGTRLVGKTGGGEDTLKEVFEQTLKSSGMKEQYSASKKKPTVRESLRSTDYTALLAQGLKFYERGAEIPKTLQETFREKMDKRRRHIEKGSQPEEGIEESLIARTHIEAVYQSAKTQFEEWKKPFAFGGLKKAERRHTAREYYLTHVMATQDPFREFTGRAIKAAYFAVFSEAIVA